MNIQDMMNNESVVISNDELERVLSKRYDGGVNAFWLSRTKKSTPVLLILINRDLANLHYFPPGDHPGFHSVGHISSLPPGGRTIFFMNSPDEEEEVPNNAIVPLKDALAAAGDFFKSQELPPSVEWFEL
jgi:immunity protein Imm1 of predicted polymorphic toxin system